MKPTHLTVVIGNSLALENVGIGPQFRRVTVELTEQQREKLKLSVQFEYVHVAMLETIMPNTGSEEGKV